MCLLKALKMLAASWEAQTGWRSTGKAGSWHTSGKRLLVFSWGLNICSFSNSLSFFTDSSCTWKPLYWGGGRGERSSGPGKEQAVP